MSVELIIYWGSERAVIHHHPSYHNWCPHRPLWYKLTHNYKHTHTHHFSCPAMNPWTATNHNSNFACVGLALDGSMVRWYKLWSTAVRIIISAAFNWTSHGQIIWESNIYHDNYPRVCAEEILSEGSNITGKRLLGAHMNRVQWIRSQHLDK